MTIICAQTLHKVLASDVVAWFDDSKFHNVFTSVQVYGYWMEGRDGEKKEGYFWAAAVMEKPYYVYGRCILEELKSKDMVRVYKSGNYFKVKLLKEWPDAVRFRVSWDREVRVGNPIIHSKYGEVVKFPYSYEDMCVARRREEAKKDENLELVVEETKELKGLVLEILSKMEELKELM